MNYYENNFIEEVRNKSDIVSVISEFLLVKKRGRNFIALCPFHAEKTPSFVISPEKQIYYCFGCGENGDIFSFLMKHQGMKFNEAMIYLSEKFSIAINNKNIDKTNNNDNKKEISNNILYEIHFFVARYFYKKLYSEQGRDANKYIQKRKITKEILKTFKIGYAPYYNDELINNLYKLNYTEKNLLDSGIFGKNDKNKLYVKFYNRLIFPIENIKGKIIAFGGRSISDNEPKYLNSKETNIFKKKNNLFALNNSLIEIKKLNQAILVEGYIDVLTAWKNGIKNVVSSLGTSFTEEQGKLISRYCNEIIIAYDNDEAGKKASLKALDILKKIKIDVKIVSIEEAKDPDEFINKLGPNNFLQKIREAKTGFRYLLDYFKNIYNYKMPEDKIKCIRSLLPYIMSFDDELLKNEYLLILSKEMDIDIKELNKIVYFGINKKNNYNYFNQFLNKKNNIKKNFDNTQLTVLKLFLNYFEYSDLFTKSILNSFTNMEINKIISFILSLSPKEKRIDVIISKLYKEKELANILACLSIDINDNASYPKLNKNEFNAYLLLVRKNYLKQELNKIIFKIKSIEKNGNNNNVNELKNKYLLYNKEVIKIAKKLKENNVCQN